MTEPLFPEPVVVEPVATPTPAPAGRTGITCEICGCRLTPTGGAIELSDKYRSWRDNDDTKASLKRTIDDLTGQVRALEATNADLKRQLEPPPAPAKRKGFLSNI